MPSSALDALLALKPRPVLLSPNMAAKEEKSPKARLLPAIAAFLERHGFRKTLRKLRAEAQLEGDDFTSVSLNLEEMYCKYSEICCSSGTTSNKEKNPGEETDIGAGAEVASKKKKKRSEDTNTDASKHIKATLNNSIVAEVNGKFCLTNKCANSDGFDQSKQVESEALNDSSQNLRKQVVKGEKIQSSVVNPKNHSEFMHREQEERLKNAQVVSDNEKGAKQDKKKRKNKPSDSLADNVKKNCIEVNHEFDMVKADQKGKTEEKKRKKNKNKENDGSALEELKGDDSHVINNLESKSSKKRKRDYSEENESEKAETGTKLSASMGTKKLASKESKKENVVVDVDSQKSSAEELSAPAYSGQEENEKGSALQKSHKRRQIGSAEPKKPFQRVNVDEVEILDERLKDNSYWAKDGAENGYGAKAQEILGQVTGRDFRHEKTKKKRGTYRGGQIDLESHSVKFNYSDEE